MNENKPVIVAQAVTKHYKLYDKPIHRLKEVLDPFRRSYHHDFIALRDVAFSIGKGEIVGVIGHNGCGKSTLLKILTGVLSATSGEVKVEGRVAALLELGAGFNPELTGIENIYLSGTLMGYSEGEMNAKLDDIVAFADIGEFVNQPVRMYSSGMFARLAFAVAVSVSPEILIVDEALSVGDMGFQEKSFSKLKEMAERGVTILVVTHSLPLVRNFCSRALWLDKGVLCRDGVASIVCDEYKNSHLKNDIKPKTTWSADDRSDKKTIEIKSLSLSSECFVLGENIELKILLKNHGKIDKFGIGVIVRDSLGTMVTLYSTIRNDLYLNSDSESITLSIPEHDFVEGTYTLSVTVVDDSALFSYDMADEALTFLVRVPKNSFGVPVAEGCFRSKHKWIY